MNDLEKLVSVIGRMIRDKYSKRKVESEELKSLRQTNSELSRVSQLYM